MKSSNNALIVLLLVTAAVLSMMLGVSMHNQAYADAPDRYGDWIMVTGARSDSNDLVYVINVPYQRMVVYYIDPVQNQMTIADTIDLKRIFRTR